MASLLTNPNKSHRGKERIRIKEGIRQPTPVRKSVLEISKSVAGLFKFHCELFKFDYRIKVRLVN